MKIKFEKSSLKGELYAPPSKSYAHRLLIAGALSGGECHFDGIIDSEDMRATLDCIEALGSQYSKIGDRVSLKGTKKEKTNVLSARESGSTLRFFIPIALVNNGTYTFTGTKRLMSRGLDVYFEIFEKQNVKYRKTDTTLEVSGQLKSGLYEVSGDISSQFITGLLFALPLLSGDSEIRVTTALESEAYVSITLDVLNRFGIEIKRQDNSFFIKGGQTYLIRDEVAEGDFSNAAFLHAFNYFGGDVSVKGLNYSSIQSDMAYLELFEMLKDSYGKIDISGCPDLGPVLMAFAAGHCGAELTGTRRLRIKESDRVEAMARELSKMGADITVYENSVIVKESPIHAPTECLFGHNDHRIVMALCVLLTHTGGEISGCEAVSKSYPHFLEDIKRLGALFEICEE